MPMYWYLRWHKWNIVKTNKQRHLLRAYAIRIMIILHIIFVSMDFVFKGRGIYNSLVLVWVRSVLYSTSQINCYEEISSGPRNEPRLHILCSIYWTYIVIYFTGNILYNTAISLNLYHLRITCYLLKNIVPCFVVNYLN